MLGLAHRGSSDAGSFRTASFKIRTVETSNMDLPDSLEATPVVEIDLNVDPILYYAQVRPLACLLTLLACLHVLA